MLAFCRVLRYSTAQTTIVSIRKKQPESQPCPVSKEWLDSVKSDATRRSYRYTIDYYLSSAGNYAIDSHDNAFFTRFQNNLAAKGHSENTIAKNLRQLLYSK